MTTNLVDIVIFRFGDGWLVQSYAHGTADPVGTGARRLTVHPTADDARRAAQRRFGRRIVTIEESK